MPDAALVFVPFAQTPATTAVLADAWESAPFCGLLLVAALSAHLWGTYALNALLDPYEWRWRRRVLRPLSALLALATAFLVPQPNSAAADPAALAHCLRTLFGAPPPEEALRGVLALLLLLGGLAFSHLAYALRPTKGAALWGLAAFFGVFWLVPLFAKDLAAELPRLAFVQLALAGAAQVALAVAFAPKCRLLPYALLPLGLWALALSPAALMLFALVWAVFLLFSRAPQVLLLNAQVWLACLALAVFGLPTAISKLPAWPSFTPAVFWGPALVWPLFALAAFVSAALPRFSSERRPFLLAGILSASITLGLCYGLPELLAVFSPFLALFSGLAWRPLPPPQRIVHR